jgi:hypothetical protein
VKRAHAAQSGARILSREELTEKLRGWTRGIFGVELEEFLVGYPLGQFNHRGSAHDLASIASFLRLFPSTGDAR